VAPNEQKASQFATIQGDDDFQFPGSSTVERSAVNRNVASSNLARGANSQIQGFEKEWISLAV
jgi:hypothetical protein